MITVNKSVEIAAAIKVKHADVEQLLLQKIGAGFDYQGHTFQIDTAASTTMTAIFTLLVAGVSNPHGGVWRTLDNINVPMDDTAVRAFILAAKTYQQSLVVAAWTLKDTVKSLTSLAAVQAFDITAGWPANNG